MSRTILAVALLVILLVGGIVLAIQNRPHDEGPIYSVSQVAAGLARHPRQWVGRTVRVRAVVSGFICPKGCAPADLPFLQRLVRGILLPELSDDQTSPFSASTTLVLGLEPRGALLDRASRLPLLGPHVPGQQISWSGRAVYRLRIQARPCIALLYYCYEGVLVDAVPTNPVYGVGG